ncbi:2,3-bisphosphoglycerate-independent phosphoglycerate mutase [soil metagenome]
MTVNAKYPVLLVILDGWGIGEPVESNAVYTAHTPVMDKLLATYPNATLSCSGEDVGLPAGQMGNSEVGHLNIGAGHVVYQWITRIDRDIDDGAFVRNPALRAAFERAATHGGRLHLLGLVSDGGVHSHAEHLAAIIGMAWEWPHVPIRIHAFTDGRDTAPDDGLAAIGDLEAIIANSPCSDIAIASISGRYFAMDRDQRWDRCEAAFDVVTGIAGPSDSSASNVVRKSYDAGVSDEFIQPTRIMPWGSDGGWIADGDEAIFFNFRSDRSRQLTQALAGGDPVPFGREGVPGIPMSMTTMTRYEADLPVAVAYPPKDVSNPVARVVSEADLTQLHIAETEKYPHVTFFLNGGREDPFPGEDRVLIPSPRVATYDLQPEMSAVGVRDAVIAAIKSGKYDFIIVNFANPDMVCHSGDLAAARIAVETVDTCLGDVLATLELAQGTALVTADHGNAEVMRVPGTDTPMTAHTTNLVPVILVSPHDALLRQAELRQDGKLSAIGTTVIELLGLTPHPDMAEQSLIVLPVG